MIPIIENHAVLFVLGLVAIATFSRVPVMGFVAGLACLLFGFTLWGDSTLYAAPMVALGLWLFLRNTVGFFLR